MKKGLKIIMFVLLFLVFQKNCNAKTNYIKLGSVIPNIRLHLKTPTVEKNKNMFQIINQNTGELLYCIEPGVILHDGNFKETLSINDAPINISQETWNYLGALTQFGYLYKDRTDIKWYVITQVLIWEYLLKDTGEIYFINNENERISLYEEEKNMILKDVENYFKHPSFSKDWDGFNDLETFEMRLNEEARIKDENNVLNNYNVDTANENLTAEVKDNELILKAKYPLCGEAIINFTNKDGLGYGAKIYYSDNSQTVMSRGLTTKYYFAKIKILYPSFTLNKIDEETKEPIKGAKYGIYYKDGSLSSTVTTDENGQVYLPEIYFNDYYLKEISAPTGYLINDEKIAFTVKDKDIVLNATNKKIKKKVTIEKYLENLDGSYELESAAKFLIYKDNKLVLETTTNNFGKSVFELTYGTYKIVQETGKEGYKLVEDYTLIIDANYQEKPLIFKNKEMYGSIEIIKKDSETLNPLEGVKFGIYDDNLNLIAEVTTNIDGIGSLENLKPGTYYLKELETNSNYELLNTEYTFEITRNNKSTLEIYNHMIIEVPKTGVNELLLSLITSVLILVGGLFLCNYEKNK